MYLFLEILRDRQLFAVSFNQKMKNKSLRGEHNSPDYFYVAAVIICCYFLVFHTRTRILSAYLKIKRKGYSTRFNIIIFHSVFLSLLTGRAQRHKIFPLNYGALV